MLKVSLGLKNFQLQGIFDIEVWPFGTLCVCKATHLKVALRKVKSLINKTFQLVIYV